MDDLTTCGCCGRQYEQTLSLAEAASEAHRSERSLARWVATGRLPSARVGRTRRVRRADLRDLMNR